MRIVVITGALGFSGRRLVRHLRVREPSHLIGIDLGLPQASKVELDEYLTVDLSDSAAVRTALRNSRPDWIFHLASTNHGTASDIYRANLLGGINLLEWARAEAPAARMLIVGSAAEYGYPEQPGQALDEQSPCRPRTPYGRTKLAVTHAALDYAADGMRVVVARPFNLIGAGIPARMLVGTVLRQMAASRPACAPISVRLGNIDTERDFLSIDDAVGAYVDLLRGDYWGEIFNICSGEPVPIRRILEKLVAMAPGPIRIESDPARFRTSDPPRVYGSLAKAREAFGFHPTTSLDESLFAAWKEHMSEATRCA